MERRSFFSLFLLGEKIDWLGKKRKKNADQSCARMKNPGAVSRGRLQTQRHQSDITLGVCPIGGGALKGEERGGSHLRNGRPHSAAAPFAALWQLIGRSALIIR